MLNVVGNSYNIKLKICNPTAPDPGNAGVGRGNKLSVLRIIPWCADGLTFLFTHIEKFIHGIICLAAACPGIGPILCIR